MGGPANGRAPLMGEPACTVMIIHVKGLFCSSSPVFSSLNSRLAARLKGLADQYELREEVRSKAVEAYHKDCFAGGLLKDCASSI